MAQPSAWLRAYCYNTRSSKTAFSNDDIVKGDVLTTATPATINYCYYCYYYSARRVARASERPNRSCSLTRVSKRASERVAPVP